MRRCSTRVCLAALSLVLTLSVTVAPALAAEPYRIVVTSESPQVRYFGDFSYDQAAVSGPNLVMARTLTKRVRAFTRPWVDYYLKPSTKTLKYLKRARPAYFDAEIDTTPGCRAGYVCLSQGSSFATHLIAGSITDIHARAWSTRTGKTAQLRDFVTSKQLPQFTERVKAAIRKADCYYGFDIKLPAAYDSFPNWVPLEQGIAVWFPEYQFGCQVMSLRVNWP